MAVASDSLARHTRDHGYRDGDLFVCFALLLLLLPSVLAAFMLRLLSVCLTVFAIPSLVIKLSPAHKPPERFLADELHLVFRMNTVVYGYISPANVTLF